MIESEKAHRPANIIENIRIGVGDTNGAIIVTSFCVEDPREKTLAPICRQRQGPLYQVANGSHQFAGRGPDRMHRPMLNVPFGENERVGRDLEITEVMFGSLQGLDIGQRQAELMDLPVPPP
jgi:hypothetical protein